jgi:hypothetical protein
MLSKVGLYFAELQEAAKLCISLGYAVHIQAGFA